MALVRRGTRAYYYQSYRDPCGRVTSRYVGGGRSALALGWLDEHHRARRRRQRARHEKRMAALDAVVRDRRREALQRLLAARPAAPTVDELLAGWYGLVEGVFRGAMAAAGCHQHKRTWRKKRMNLQERAEAEKRLAEYWARVESGDPTVYRSVKMAFDGAPDESIEAGGGDLPARVVEGLTGRLAGTNLYRREAIARKLARVRGDLEGPDPSPVERLLAKRAAVCWLAAYEADLACQGWDALAGDKVATYFERRRDGAHRRLLSALRALGVLRKLAAPAYRPRVDFGGRLADVAHARRN
jgi:hypothetical protein